MSDGTITKEELAERCKRAAAKGWGAVAVRVFWGEADERKIMVPGGKRTRWSALCERIWAVAPNWHRVEFVDAKGSTVDVIRRDPAELDELPEDLAALATDAQAGGVSPPMGSQLAAFAGLMKIFVLALDKVQANHVHQREQDRAMMKEVVTASNKNADLYAQRLEGLEKLVGRSIEREFQMARLQAKLAARVTPESESTSDEAFDRFMDAIEKFQGGGQHGGNNGTS